MGLIFLIYKSTPALCWVCWALSEPMRICLLLQLMCNVVNKHNICSLAQHEESSKPQSCCILGLRAYARIQAHPSGSTCTVCKLLQLSEFNLSASTDDLTISITLIIGNDHAVLCARFSSTQHPKDSTCKIWAPDVASTLHGLPLLIYILLQQPCTRVCVCAYTITCMYTVCAHYMCLSACLQKTHAPTPLH